VFSRYLKEPSYPTSINSNKYSKGPKNQQDRLVNRIFGNENNYKMIKSLMNNVQKPKENYAQQNKSNNVGYGSRPPLNKRSSNRRDYTPSHKKDMSMADPYNDHPVGQLSDAERAQSEKNIKQDKDLDVKLEKALIDLSEHKNNFYKDKSEFDKQIEQTMQDKDARIRQTFYGNGPYPGSHNIVSTNGVPEPSSINSSNYYKPIGYSTGTRFRPSTQENSDKRGSVGGE